MEDKDLLVLRNGPRGGHQGRDSTERGRTAAGWGLGTRVMALMNLARCHRVGEQSLLGPQLQDSQPTEPPVPSTFT